MEQDATAFRFRIKAGCKECDTLINEYARLAQIYADVVSASLSDSDHRRVFLLELAKTSCEAARQKMEGHHCSWSELEPS